jgi:hypothetical protein
MAVMTGEAEATSALNFPKRQLRSCEWQIVSIHAEMMKQVLET